MIAVVQRVREATVTLNEKRIGQIGPGLLVLLGIANGDTRKEADWLAAKILHLRIFEDSGGKMNQSIADIGGGILVVSQFTLLGDCRKGRRPSFGAAATPDAAKDRYAHFVDQIRGTGLQVETGQFGGDMQVALTNDGPVTLIVETP